jgi:hypothetical protein
MKLAMEYVEMGMCYMKALDGSRSHSVSRYQLAIY